MSTNPNPLLAADADSRRQSPTDSPNDPVKPCPLRKKRRLTLKLRSRHQKPYAGIPFELAVDGLTISPQGAETDSDGLIDYEIPDGSRKAVLKAWFDRVGEPETYLFDLVEPVPPSSDAGFVGRVRALGIHPGPDGRLTPAHIRELQRLLGLPESGVDDESLRATVASIHES